MNVRRWQFHCAALLIGLGALGAGCSPTEMSAVAPEPAIAFDSTITIDELMDAVVMRQADAIWGAVQFGDADTNFALSGPDTDEGWKAIRDAALTMAEVTNSLMIPGRHAAPAGKEAGEGELSGPEIDALIESNRPAWNAFAQALKANARETLQAIERRDADAMLELGGTLDEVCEGCHKTFWYPNQ